MRVCARVCGVGGVIEKERQKESGKDGKRIKRKQMTGEKKKR